MTSLNSLDALIPKIPFSFFSRFLGLGHLRGPRVSLGRILGVLSIEPFWGRGGSSQGAQSTPAPLNCKLSCPRVCTILGPGYVSNNWGGGMHCQSPHARAPLELHRHEGKAFLRRAPLQTPPEAFGDIAFESDEEDDEEYCATTPTLRVDQFQFSWSRGSDVLSPPPGCPPEHGSTPKHGSPPKHGTTPKHSCSPCFPPQHLLSPTNSGQSGHPGGLSRIKYVCAITQLSLL